MADGIPYMPYPMPAAPVAAVDGFGGWIGAILVASMLAGRGGFGLWTGVAPVAAPFVEGCVTPATLTATAAGIIEAINSNSIQQSIGDLKAQVPLVGAQNQLAICQAEGDINNQANVHATALLSQMNVDMNRITVGQQMIEKSICDASQFINKNIYDGTTMNLAATKDVGLQVALNAKDLLAAGKDNTYALAKAIKDDGDLTRGILVAQNEANLNRMLVTAQNEVIELRGDQRLDRRSRETEVNVTQTVNQNNAQAQAQSQSQSQFQFLVNRLDSLAGEIQVVKQGQVIFNSGVMAASGTQAAANTRVA